MEIACYLYTSLLSGTDKVIKNHHQDYQFQRELINSFIKSLSCRNQSFDLLYKSMDWFLYNRDLRHERIKGTEITWVN